MQQSRIQFFWYYVVPVFVWAWVIFFLSSLSGSQTGSGGGTLSFILERKGAHVAEYFIFTLLLLRLFLQFMVLERAVVWTFIGALLYASSDEYHQLFVFGREGKFSDVMVDFIGITLAFLVFVLWRRLCLSSPKTPSNHEKFLSIDSMIECKRK